MGKQGDMKRSDIYGGKYFFAELFLLLVHHIINNVKNYYFVRCKKQLIYRQIKAGPFKRLTKSNLIWTLWIISVLYRTQKNCTSQPMARLLTNIKIHRKVVSLANDDQAKSVSCESHTLGETVMGMLAFTVLNLILKFYWCSTIRNKYIQILPNHSLKTNQNLILNQSTLKHQSKTILSGHVSRCLQMRLIPRPLLLPGTLCPSLSIIRVSRIFMPITGVRTRKWTRFRSN